MRPRHLSLAPSLAITCVLALGLGACGSDDEDKGADTTSAPNTLAPEDVKVSAAEVTAGMTKLPATIAAAITAIGAPDADAKLARIQEEWFSFEGTVRDTDTDLYLQIEDQLAPLQRQIEDGDRAAATATAATVSGLLTEYLTKYPS